MDINTLLSDGRQDEAVKDAMRVVRRTLVIAMHDYAKAAMDAANDTLMAVQEAAPCAAVWPTMDAYTMYVSRTQEAADSVTRATGMLLMSEETGNADIDNMNREAKVEEIEIHIVSALLEGAKRV